MMDATCHAKFHLPPKYLFDNISSSESSGERFINKLDTFTESVRPFIPPLAILYVVTIFSLKNKLSTRPAYSLRTPLILWNFFMASLSLVFSYQFIIYLTARISDRGLFGGIFYQKNRVDQDTWQVLFAWSKVIELVDTFFIVLRKRPLTALHWSHHAITLIYGFYVIKEPHILPSLVLNSLIHIVMYSYYGLRALEYNVPRKFTMTLTGSQIAQMIICMIVIMKAMYYRHAGCLDSPSYFIDFYGIFMFSFYTFMFGKFFLNTYLKDEGKTREKRTEAKTQ